MLGPNIPTYEEATSSRSPSRNDAGHIGGCSEAEERAGLLGQQSSSNYRCPTVEDARDSEDLLMGSARLRRSSDESLHRELEQFEVIDPPTENQSTSRRAYHQFQKRLSTLANSVSSSFPRFRFPKLNFHFRWSGLSDISYTKFFEFFLPYYRLFIVFFAIIIVYSLLASDLFNFQARTILGQVFDPASVQNYAINHVRVERIQHYLEYLTRFGHISGTDGDKVLGKYIEDELISFGMDTVEIKDYYVYLNYPKQGGRSVSIVQPKNLAWQMNIEDQQAQEMPQPPHVFHGYSASGDVTGRLLYAGYGRPEDYLTLQSKGVNFTGAIVLVRQSGANLDNGMIVQTAERAGAIGCLISSGNWDVPIDQDVGSGDMIVRGSVSLMAQVMGDVLTPGYASTKDAVTLSRKGNPGLVNIPSLPISRNNAIYLLKILEGLGVPLKVDAENKSQLLPLWTGNDSSPIVRLQNQLVDKDKQRITNVFALIKGTEQSNQIIIGNHRDAWCWGASSPNSGTAVMLEVARLFGEMMTFGWRPLRSILFANWDAGEYNHVGSTEWVEDHAKNLRLNGVAYINLGTAFSGESFQAAGSPALEAVLLNVLSRINDPKSKSSLLELWEKKFPGLGATGDYGAFQHFAGMASIDIGFRGTEKSAVNSCHDTYSLLTQRDPNLDYPYTMAQILSLLILELADSSNMPFNMTNYASHASSWFSDLEAHVNMKATGVGNQRKSLDLTSLQDAVELMRQNMPLFDNKVAEWADEDDGDFSAELDSSVSTVHRINHNIRMANFEHHLVMDEGLWGRPWFKHALMAPKQENACEVEYFPSIRDAVDAGNWEAAQENAFKVAHKLKAATDKILN